jgi:endonuclease/exonuclease/phosphatase family metal-dependent hydrolase
LIVQAFFFLVLMLGLPQRCTFNRPSFTPNDSLETPVPADANSESRLLEIGHASKPEPVTQAPSEIKVVSYNIRWRSGEALHKLAQLLKDDTEIGGASILGLQEVDRHKQRSGKTNTAKILAEELGMHYAWAAPDSPKSEREEETGVVILSSYPITDVRRLVLPHEGPGHRRRVALGATITIGKASLRVYSVHSETRIPIDKKLEQMKAVLDDLAGYPKDMPAIVLGDLNTWEPEAVARTFKLFTAEAFHTPFDDSPTFFRRALFVSIDLKLDWIWLRNFEETSYGVDRTIELSDHWPLWVVLRMKTGAASTP